MAGSGAGTEISRIAESAQCVVAAARFYVFKKDITPTMITESKMKQAMKYVDVDDRNIIKNMFQKLDEKWFTSLTLTANRLHKLYGRSASSKQYTFHRGSKWVDRFENRFKVWNKVHGRVFSNINKYTPADIWMTSKKLNSYQWNDIDVMAAANKFLLSKLKTNDIIGISLKKTSDAHVTYFNQPNAIKYDFKFTSTSISTGTDFFDSKDVYMFYNKGKIQFRSFSAQAESWQGEVKGKESNSGKAGGGVIQTIFKKTFPQKPKTKTLLTKPSVVASNTKKPTNLSAGFLNEMYKNYSKISKGKKITLSQMSVGLRKQTPSWIYSKFLGVELLSKISSLSPTERDKLTSVLVLYATSSSPDSAPFVKIG